METLLKKYTTLITYLQKLDKPLYIACSGGLDSRFMLTVANKFARKVKALTVIGPHISVHEQEYAKKFLFEQNISYELVYLNVLENALIGANSMERCYFCKKALFIELQKHCEMNTLLIDGTNANDLQEFRPGLLALKELNIYSPLALHGITKQEIRVLAQDIGLSDPLQVARPCLLTRFAYGIEADITTLEFIAQLENILGKKGLQNFRVRVPAQKEFFLQIGMPESATIKDSCKQVFASLNVDMPIQFTESVSGYYDKKITT